MDVVGYTPAVYYDTVLTAPKNLTLIPPPSRIHQQLLAGSTVRVWGKYGADLLVRNIGQNIMHPVSDPSWTLGFLSGWSGGAINYGIGVGNPWPGTTYLLPANDGTTAEEAAFDLTRTTGDPPYLVGNSVIGYNAQVGNHPKAKKLFNAGETEYLVYYCALQWTINEQPGTAGVLWAYDTANTLGDLPRMVKVTRTDDPTKAVYVSVLEAGPGLLEGGPYRNSGLSPAAMTALGFSGTLNPQNYGEPGWLTYEWAPNAPPGPAY